METKRNKTMTELYPLKIIEKLIKEEGTDFDAVYIIGPDDLKKKVAETLKNQGITDDKLHYRIYS